MTAADFRRIALGLRGAVEGAHMGHPDFRIDNRIFASLQADGVTGSVKLTPDEQQHLMDRARDAFTPASGAWGRGGWTVVQLEVASEEALGEALTLASRHVAASRPPKTSGRAGRSTPRPPAVRAARRRDVARRSPEVDRYIADCPAVVRPVLETIRSAVLELAPDAEEKIAYGMPAYHRHGVLIYFAAFRNHIGVYPPVEGDARLQRALKPYRGPRGNLKFPLAEPIPYGLIRRVVERRMQEQSRRARR